ncbi:MAG: hypothetical protein ACXW0J_02785 [Nitrososphaeraceae archaeon]
MIKVTNHLGKELPTAKQDGIYPKLKIHKDDIHRDDPVVILFYEPSKGILMAQNSEHRNDPDMPIGKVLMWDEDQFVVFDKSITIQNCSTQSH